MILETERLLLREFTIYDAPFIIELLNSPGWLQYIGDRHVKTIADAEAYLINGPIKSYEANGFGLYIVVAKEGEVPIGMCGLINRDTLPQPDIGFAFLPFYLGKGFGYEIAGAMLRHAQEKLGLKQVLAITLPDNISSVKLLQKIGMKLEHNIQIGEDELMLFSTP